MSVNKRFGLYNYSTGTDNPENKYWKKKYFQPFNNT